jgi:hypothetical protein
MEIIVLDGNSSVMKLYETTSPRNQLLLDSQFIEFDAVLLIWS